MDLASVVVLGEVEQETASTVRRGVVVVSISSGRLPSLLKVASQISRTEALAR